MERAVECGLTMEQFWGYTPHEFMLYLRAYQKRERRLLEGHAHLTACLMNCWTKKGQKITARKLIGDPPGKISSDTCSSPEEFRAKLRAARRDKK